MHHVTAPSSHQVSTKGSARIRGSDKRRPQPQNRCHQMPVAAEIDFQEFGLPPSDLDFTFVPDGVETFEGPTFDDVVPREVRPMHGRTTTPKLLLQKEQPWHRTAAYLFAQNMNQLQVAKAVGKTSAAVNLLFAQPWFQKMVVELIHEERIADNALALLRNAAPAAAMAMINIAQNTDGKASLGLQLKASESILGRVLGPVGKEKVTNTGGTDDTFAVDELEQQVSDIKEQLRIL